MGNMVLSELERIVAKAKEANQLSTVDGDCDVANILDILRVYIADKHDKSLEELTAEELRYAVQTLQQITAIACTEQDL